MHVILKSHNNSVFSYQKRKKPICPYTICTIYSGKLYGKPLCRDNIMKLKYRKQIKKINRLCSTAIKFGKVICLNRNVIKNKNTEPAIFNEL